MYFRVQKKKKKTGPTVKIHTNHDESERLRWCQGPSRLTHHRDLRSSQ